jgi:hypothetical protein
MEKISGFEKLLNDLSAIYPLGHFDWVNRENQVRNYVDPQGGVWFIGSGKPVGPCGCKLEVGSNSQRSWYFCPNHKECGVLIISLASNNVYWLKTKE